MDAAIHAALSRVSENSAPPLFVEAVRHAVLPGGGRLRPRLCIQISAATGDRHPVAADVAAAAIEFLHCASLVHDDLPAFDDAAIRRGKPAVHAAYGQPLAILAGDALIVLAFEELGRIAVTTGAVGGGLIGIVARSVGLPGGIAAGQAWESEPDVDLERYHDAKTAALFVAAAEAGALAGGADPARWSELGRALGRAYQAADDVRDVVGSAAALGKPVGRDSVNERPNLVAAAGLDAAIATVRRRIAEAMETVPACPGADDVRDLIAAEAARLLPGRRKVEAA